MNGTTRREFFQTTGVALLMAGTAVGALADEALSPPKGSAYENVHVPVPLPFDAKSLKGISEKLIQSHWESNYGGAVKALNAIRGKLPAALADANTPAYLYTALKREQMLRTGSVVLHELYFANLGGDGKVSTALRTRIAQAFGTYDAWETEFRKIGQGLGGGSGWVMLGHNHRLNLLENYSMTDHSTAPADTTPILMMDMYEHAYQMDYGAAVAKYIDAFFVNIQWDVVAARLNASGNAHAG